MGQVRVFHTALPQVLCNLHPYYYEFYCFRIPGISCGRSTEYEDCRARAHEIIAQQIMLKIIAEIRSDIIALELLLANTHLCNIFAYTKFSTHPRYNDLFTCNLCILLCTDKTRIDIFVAETMSTAANDFSRTRTLTLLYMCN